MARISNGFVGTFATNGDLTAKFPPNEYAGCSANVGLVAPITKVISDGVSWNDIASSVSGGGNNETAMFKPWKLATFGDSRANCGATAPDVSGSQTMTEVRTPAHISAYMGDAEIVRNYGVSGDAVAGWSLTSRTGGKTFSDLASSDIDGVFVQYGINDCIANTAAATTIANLKALCTEILKSNKRLVLEEINPVNSAATNHVAAQALADAVNAEMESWIGNFRDVARFSKTAALLKGASGYASTAYYNTDGIHFIRAGAARAGRVVAASFRELLSQRNGLFPARDNRNPNMLSAISPSAFTAFEAGSATGTTITSGQDAGGFYTQWDYTPATFASGECRARLELSANFNTASSPYYALTGSELLQASARVVVDDGAGGAPNVYSVAMRHRFYTAGVFRDWGLIPAGAPTANQPDFSEAMDEVLIAPAVTNTAASVSAAPSSGGGYQLQVYVSSQNGARPVRVRVYNAQLRIVGYKATPVTVTPPASTVAYTNSTPVKQQIVISGGTVNVIAQGGVTTGLTAGVFVLDTADTLTLTYTVAPLMLVKHLA